MQYYYLTRVTLLQPVMDYYKKLAIIIYCVDQSFFRMTQDSEIAENESIEGIDNYNLLICLET